MRSKGIFFAIAFFLVGIPTAFAQAPFGDSFDTYVNGNIYPQGHWQNNVHAWHVIDTGCYNNIGKCIITTGVNGQNWKTGTDLAVGKWTIRFKVLDPISTRFPGLSMYFASSQNARGQSDLHLIGDQNGTSMVLDNRGQTLASGISQNEWHTLTYSWDMSNPSYCTFFVQVDDGPIATSSPSIGGPENCYSNIYSERTIGALSLYEYFLGGRVMLDDIEDGPIDTSCSWNCDGKIPELLSDSFDTFNDLGWLTPETPYGTQIPFAFDDGSTGNCHTGGCVRAQGGMGGLITPSHASSMYLETGVGTTSGAYTFWVRNNASNYAEARLCTGPWSACTYGYEIMVLGSFRADNEWHQYYVGWRQGNTNLEYCVLQDSTAKETCSWQESTFVNNTTIDGIQLYAYVTVPTQQYSIWFDDLQYQTGSGTCTTKCYSNVMFLPGIESSRLYAVSNGTETKLWEPLSDSRASQLSMGAYGSSSNSTIYTKEVIDNVGPFDVYGGLIDFMNTLTADGTIREWSAVPYDWRLSLDEILRCGKKDGSNISYLQSTSTPYIVQELQRLAATSKSGKVTIVAHSNGGLLAKALVQALGNEASKYIDTIVFVAVPHLGTPEAVGALANGYQAGIKFLLSDAQARNLALNMPMSYNLLPSTNYFTYVDDPVITISSSTLPEWVSIYGDTIHSTERLSNFLNDPNRTKPTLNDLNTPAIGNTYLFNLAQKAHQSLDSWTPPQGIRTYNIAGWGRETLSSVEYRKEYTRTCSQWSQGQCMAYGIGSKITLTPKFVIDGDGTVVAPSALWGATTGTENLWFDLLKYNTDHKCLSLTCGSHANLLSISDLNTSIQTILKGDLSLNNYESTTTSPNYTGRINRLHFVLHSPLSLGFYDTLGSYIGELSTSSNQIPNAFYDKIGDVQYLSIPKDLGGTLVLSGKESGSFTLDIQEWQDGQKASEVSYAAIPAATSTTATLNIDPLTSPTASGTLRVDEYGNGQTIYELQPKSRTNTLYQFSGFQQPINDIRVYQGVVPSVFKAGSTIPIKFKLKDLLGVSVQASTTPLFLSPVKCAALNAQVNETQIAAAGSDGALFRWDPTDMQYIYNWNTKGLSAGYWYTISVRLDDGTKYSVQVGLK